MKEKTHPLYQDVLFVDSSTGASFVIGSTLQPKERGTYEGKEYPLYKVPVSSASHPFFTKANQFVDAAGRMDKFTKRYQKKSEEIKNLQKQAAAAPALKKSGKK